MKRCVLQFLVGVTSFLWVVNTSLADTRIVGGVLAPPTAWPSTVGILSKDAVDAIEAGQYTNIPPSDANFQGQFCAGALVGSRWVLTAAHCVASNGVGLSPDRFYVLVGTNDLGNGGERVTLNRIIIHPDYKHNTADADIAMLELSRAVTIAPVPVYGSDVSVGAMATLVGWGDLTSEENTAVFPKLLHEVDVPVVSWSACRSVYGAALTQNMFCAGYFSGGKDSCQGDSGGPLYVYINKAWRQAGIISWGNGCALPGNYGVYTRLSRFHAWIESVSGVSGSGGDSGGGGFWWPLLVLLAPGLFFSKSNRFSGSR